MKGILLSTIFFWTLTIQAQLAYEGQVVDALSGNPIPFVNIGVVGRGIGTVSHEDGRFLLEFRPGEVDAGDILRISSLGYTPREIPLARLDTRKKVFVFRLEPEPISLSEVVVSSAELMEVEEEHGYPDLIGKGIGYWKDSVALGGELASAIRMRKGLYRLNSLYFHILENPSDSVQLRINFYSSNRNSGIPGENLNKSGKNILHTVKAGTIFSVIDLKPYDLWVRDDFIVSLELLGVHGTPQVMLSLPAGNHPNGKSYKRYASQGDWETIDGAVVGFSVQATLFTDNPRRMPSPREVRKRLRSESEISGIVFSAGPALRGQKISQPMEGATVINYTRNTTVQTDKWGRYRMKVAKGDILGVSYPGKYQLIVEVTEPRNFNFQLHSSRELNMQRIDAE
jgi:hypothetical protein